jgi:tRNA(Ile)-lysidine synthase
VSDAPVVERVLGLVRARGLLEQGAACVALVSGGRDSTCLLDVLVTLLGAPRVRALHLNYGLRADAADGDEEHVRELCARLCVALGVERAPAPPSSGNLQAWARELRYAAARAAAAGDRALIATGHTASDQVETILYRLAASPGRRSLLGMPERDGALVRPLLELTREDTTEYCRARGLRWRDDATNAELRFARGRLRQELLPALRRIHPAAEANVLRTAALLRGEAQALDALVDEILAGDDALALGRLHDLEPAIARLVLVRMAEAAGATHLPGVAARLGDLTALGARGGSQTLDVGGGVRAVVEYGTLRFERSGEDRPAAEVPLAVPGETRFGDWILTAELHRTTAADALARRRPDGAVAVLDAAAVDLSGLRVRGWRAGDTIRPIGLAGGTKALSDLFTDRRVPRAVRARMPLVVCGEEILWIAGLATAERVRVTSRTREAAVIVAAPAGAD